MNRHFLKTLGPGILFASTAIGVSHLVQSTRAGADYGFALLWAVLLANLMKYPFFEYGSRYANARGESIIDGYKRIGNWMLWLYLLITVGSMFFVSAAVFFVTAGFLDNLLGLSKLVAWPMFPTTLLFAVCLGILLIGSYKALDGLIKLIAAVLLVCTLIAFGVALVNGPEPRQAGFMPPAMWDGAGLAFIIALMGWMPTALDLSSWNSLWTIERIKQTGYRPTMRETALDFNIGYWTSAILAVCFLTLGAYLLHGTGKIMPVASHLFANSVVTLYTETIGSWSYLIIAAAAFSIMFGTSIAVFDGYARSLERSVGLALIPRRQKTYDTATESFDPAGFRPREFRHAYRLALVLVAAGAYIIITFFKSNLKQLVDLSTTISFLISPVIAVVNFRLVSSKYLQAGDQPPAWMKALSYAGIVFLTGFSVFYFVYKISPS